MRLIECRCLTAEMSGEARAATLVVGRQKPGTSGAVDTRFLRAPCNRILLLQCLAFCHILQCR